METTEERGGAIEIHEVGHPGIEPPPRCQLDANERVHHSARR